MTDETTDTGLYDPYVTPAGRFRRWQTSGNIDCYQNGVWMTIPAVAQAEITRLREALAAEREACAKVLEAMMSDVPAPRSYVMVHFVMGLEAGATAIRARGET